MQSVSVQKQILKIYFALTQYVLPLDLITKEVFGQWMEVGGCSCFCFNLSCFCFFSFNCYLQVLRLITESDVPAHTLQVNYCRTLVKIFVKIKL